MSRSSSPQDANQNRPRRRGADAVASEPSAAPILLQLPDLSDQLVEYLGAAEASPVEISPGSPGIQDAVSVAAVGVTAPQAETEDHESGFDDEFDSAADDSLDDAADADSASEIRERRRKRRQRQEQSGAPIWSTTSGRVTLAGGVVLLGLLAAVVFSPSGQNDSETDAWGDSVATDGEGSNQFVQVTGPESSDAGPAGWSSEPTTVPEPSPYLAEAKQAAQADFQSTGQAPVNTSYLPPEPYESTYARNAESTYPTQPASQNPPAANAPYTTQPASHLQPAAEAYVSESEVQPNPNYVADPIEPQAGIRTQSPGRFIPTPRVARKDGARTENATPWNADAAADSDGSQQGQFQQPATGGNRYSTSIDSSFEPAGGYGEPSQYGQPQRQDGFKPYVESGRLQTNPHIH